MRAKRSAFSMTELLVVMAVILLIASLFIAMTGEVYSRAMEVMCENNLAATWAGCVMFGNQHGGRLPRAWNNVTDSGARLRWYAAISEYLDSNDVIACPLGEKAESASDGALSLPIFYCNYGAARGDRCYYQWKQFNSGKEWILNEPDPVYPYTTQLLFPYEADANPDKYSYAGTVFTPDLLAGYSQVWIIGDVHERHTIPTDAELSALAAFLEERGGLHLWLSHSVYNQVAPRLLPALGVPVSVTGNAAASSSYTSSGHDVMAGVAKLGGSEPWPQSTLQVGEPAEVIARKPGGEPGIVAFDSGAGRVLVHHAIDSVMLNYGTSCYFHEHGQWPSPNKYFSDDYDIKQYCINAAGWLFGGLKSGGACSYGYNNRLGTGQGTVAPDTIVLMDYHDWEIDRDGQGADHGDGYVALRHSGKANALLASGRVKALKLDDLEPGMWTPALGD